MKLPIFFLQHGDTYIHCDDCKTCVKPRYKHCEECGRCTKPNHTCGEKPLGEAKRDYMGS